MNQEILGIDAALGAFRHQQAQGKSIDAIVDRVEAGLTFRMCGDFISDATAQVGIASIYEDKGFRFRIIKVDIGAAGYRCDGKQKNETSEGLPI